VHAWPSPERAGRDEDELTDEREIQERVVQRVVSRIRTAYPDLDVAGHLETGRPTAVLLRQAVIRSVVLLVVGSRGHGAIQGFFLGSVSHGLVLTCDCPVLVVKGEV
jgi:nucleotide-binding universal stress UspA family protein